MKAEIVKLKVKALGHRVTVLIISLGPASVDLAKQFIHLMSHLFGGGCTGG